MCVCGSLPNHVPITPLFKKLGQSTHKNYCLQFEKERKKEAEKRRQEQQVEDSNLGKKNGLEKETNQVKSRQVFFCFLKGCVCYIFASLFFMCKIEHLWNKEECFLFHLESSFLSWDNQFLTFQIFKCHNVIKCPNMKLETHFTEYLAK